MAASIPGKISRTSDDRTQRQRRLTRLRALDIAFLPRATAIFQAALLRFLAATVAARVAVVADRAARRTLD